MDGGGLNAHPVYEQHDLCVANIWVASARASESSKESEREASGPAYKLGNL
jgi:hypothetical protein